MQRKFLKRYQYLAFLLLASLTVSMITLPGTALAHAILIESRPADGATVPSGHVDLMLRYNSRIDAGRSRVTIGPAGGPAGGEQHVLAIAPGPRPDILVASTELAPGPCVLHWQVLAIDGHITRGEVRFTAAP